MKPAPNGFTWIANQSKGGTGLGKPGGLTVFKYNFVAPELNVKREHKRSGHKVDHYAIVQRTTVKDVVHNCYYPGPGEHMRLGMTAKIKGKEYKHYVKISPQMSALIRKGEQEHLDDALRAYELTYKAVADAINSLAGVRFGPAPNPGAAFKLVEDAVAKKLPQAFKGDWRDCRKEYDRLLPATESRDKKGWHSIMAGPETTIHSKRKIVSEILKTPTTKIGLVPSTKLVNL